MKIVQESNKLFKWEKEWKSAKISPSEEQTVNFLNTLKSADVIQNILRRRRIATNITIINQNRVFRNAHMWPSGVGAEN